MLSRRLFFGLSSLALPAASAAAPRRVAKTFRLNAAQTVAADEIAAVSLDSTFGAGFEFLKITLRNGATFETEIPKWQPADFRVDPFRLKREIETAMSERAV